MSVESASALGEEHLHLSPRSPSTSDARMHVPSSPSILASRKAGSDSMGVDSSCRSPQKHQQRDDFHPQTPTNNNDHHHHHPPTEEFDDEGNVVKVENLVFIEGILGQGAFGTVRLARRKLNYNAHHHIHGSTSMDCTSSSGAGSSSDPTSVSTTPGGSTRHADNQKHIISLETAPKLPPIALYDESPASRGRRRRRRHLSKSVSEPQKKSTFFSEKTSEEIEKEKGFLDFFEINF